MRSSNVCVLKNQAIVLLTGFLLAVAVRAENPNKKYVTTEAKRGAPGEAALKNQGRHNSSAFTVAEIEPNNTTQEAQVLTGASPLVVNGNAEVSDDGQLVLDGDDIEDLFRVTTTAPGINITLDNFSSDCDLWLIDPDDLSVLGASLTIAATGPEVIDNAGLPAGTYLIGVTIFDPDPLGPDNTSYELTITGEFGDGTPGPTPVGTLVYHQITSFSEEPAAGQGWQHVLSDNGGHVVWYTQRNPKRVFVANADGSNIRELANQGTDRLTQVDISADGSKVAYIGGPFASGHQVNSVNADGSNGRALLTLSQLRIGTLRLTGDGSKIFFNVVSDATIQGSGDLIERGVYSINFDGSGRQQVVGPASIAGLLGIPAGDVVSFEGFTNGPEVDVSFDGARFVFVAKTTQTGERHVFTANGNGSGVRRIFGPITSNPIAVGMSRNGEKVAFIVTIEGIREGYTANFDGSQLLRIASNEQFTFTDGNDVGDQISLTADGSKVIFDGFFPLLFNSDGSGVLQLSANTVGSAGFPLIVGSLARATMSSDGARVLFSFKSPENRNQLATLDINPASLGEAPALTDITVNPDVVAVNNASNATIRVKVSTANNVDYVGNAVLLNGLLDTKVTRRTFFDDGVSGGDEVAGDGIFTHNAIQAFADAEIGPRILRINAEVFSADGRLHGTAVDIEPFAVVQNPPVSVDIPEGNIPNTFSLSQNYPNPFNPETRIEYDLPKAAHVHIEVFNLLGQRIITLIDEKKPAGSYTITWNGRTKDGEQAASGVYIYQLKTERFQKSRKLVLLR